MYPNIEVFVNECFCNYLYRYFVMLLFYFMFFVRR